MYLFICLLFIIVNIIYIDERNEAIFRDNPFRDSLHLVLAEMQEKPDTSHAPCGL